MAPPLAVRKNCIQYAIGFVMVLSIWYSSVSWLASCIVTVIGWAVVFISISNGGVALSIVLCDFVAWMMRRLHWQESCTTLQDVPRCLSLWIPTLTAFGYAWARLFPWASQPAFATAVQVLLLKAVYLKTLRFVLSTETYTQLLSARIDTEFVERRNSMRKRPPPVALLLMIGAYLCTRREAFEEIHQYAGPGYMVALFLPQACRELWRLLKTRVLEPLPPQLSPLLWRLSYVPATSESQDASSEEDVCAICLDALSCSIAAESVAAAPAALRRMRMPSLSWCRTTGGHACPSAVRSLSPLSLLDGRMVTLRCGHTFHAGCANEIYVAESPLRCPTCRTRWLCEPDYAEPEQKAVHHIGILTAAVLYSMTLAINSWWIH
eukprot:TRINITY_DN91567_c0_g1_i1.p1 TRINITY_DN91567_c0_g1~~TRINITY_DN91567_c0_g1_i1.p1  ORF type:complete len:379 (+),score=51.35 TRINITY_DN91567_c0_g1_i1:70-1206(+)